MFRIDAELELRDAFKCLDSESNRLMALLVLLN